MFGKVVEERDRLLEWLKNEREKVFLIKDDEEKREMEVTLKQEEKEMENFFNCCLIGMVLTVKKID